MERSRVYAFIDSQNLNLGIRNNIIRNKRFLYKGWKLDFRRFRIHLKDKYKVEKAFLFIGYKVGNKRLYSFLKKSGYSLIFKPTIEVTKWRKSTVTKGNVDAELVLHTMIQYPNFNKAIIVSGDGDFHCLLEYLVKNKKLGRLLIPNRMSFSSLLWQFKEYIDFINVLKNKLKYRK